MLIERFAAYYAENKGKNIREQTFETDDFDLETILKQQSDKWEEI